MFQCNSHVTEGENELLSQEKNTAAYAIEKTLHETMQIKGGVSAAETKVWHQQKNRYLLWSSMDYFLKENMNIKGQFSYIQGDIKGGSMRESINGLMTLQWLPGDNHIVAFSLSPRRDTLFAEADDFLSAQVVYHTAIHSQLIVGGGVEYQQNHAYPLMDIAWHALPCLRLSAAYTPGIDIPSWTSLYDNDYYVQTPAVLPSPEKRFFVAEKASYYWGEKNTAELELYQGDWATYMYWVVDQQTNALQPATKTDISLSGAQGTLHYLWKNISCRFSVAYALPENIPYVPSFSAATCLEYMGKGWGAAVGYAYLPSRHYSDTTDAQLAGFGNLTLSVKKEIRKGIELTLSGENLLGEKIEMQPDFVRNSASCTAGLHMTF
jgi:hypothetical protein